MAWQTLPNGRRFHRGTIASPYVPSTPTDPRSALPKSQRSHEDSELGGGTTLTSWTDQPLPGATPPPAAPLLLPVMPAAPPFPVPVPQTNSENPILRKFADLSPDPRKVP